MQQPKPAGSASLLPVKKPRADTEAETASAFTSCVNENIREHLSKNPLIFTESLSGQDTSVGFHSWISSNYPLSTCQVSVLWLRSSWPSVEPCARVELTLGISLHAWNFSTGPGLPKVWWGPRSASGITTSIALPHCTVDHAALRGSQPICTQHLQEKDPQHRGSLSHRWGHLNLATWIWNRSWKVDFSELSLY